MKPYILLILLVLIVFSYSLTFSFIRGDDYAFIIENPKLDMPLSMLSTLFIEPLWQSAGVIEVSPVYYRPVFYLFYVINYKIWGLNPMGYHLSKVLLHLGSAILLYRCAMELFNEDRTVSLVAASLFAVHPVNSQTVFYISAVDSIFGFFAVMTLYLFINKKIWLSILSYLLALLSKETAVIIPFVLLLLGLHKKGLRKGLTAFLPFAAATLVYFLVRSTIVELPFGAGSRQPAFVQGLTMAVAAADYIRLLLFPYPLQPLYQERWFTSVADPKALSSITVLGLLIWLVFVSKKAGLLPIFIASSLLFLAPAVWKVNTFPLEPGFEYIAGRYLYVPSMFTALSAAFFVARRAEGVEKKRMVIGAFLVVVLFSCMTFRAGMIWKNSICFYRAVIEREPGSASAHINLGNAYFDQRRFDDAIHEYNTALRLQDHWNIHYNLGSAYYMKGDAFNAVPEYETALRMNPDHPETLKSLRIVYEMKKIRSRQQNP